MKAKCPHCESGCDQCKGGFVEVSMPSQYVAKVCNDCGEEVGGRAIGPGFPPLPERPEPQAICPDCGTNNLRWGEVVST